jgi:hypothetical protein
MKHLLKWHTPSPVWPLALADGGTAPVRFERPLILRFAGDDFMARLQQVLATDPSRVVEYAVRHETWQTPPTAQAGWQTLAQETGEAPPKLYQPAHNRFYLVTASFVCRTHGLPDRLLDPAQQDRASMVIRRLVARPGQTLNAKVPSTYDEHGWFGDRQAGSWIKVANPDVDAPAGEERLPMFPSVFPDRDRKRRLLAGLIPVASREVYEGGGTQAPLAATGSDPSVDPRYARYSAEVGASLRRLSDSAMTFTTEAARQELVFLLVSLGTFLGEMWPGGMPACISNVLGANAHNIKTRTWVALLDNANAPARRAAILVGDTPSGLFPNADAFSIAEIRSGASSVSGPLATAMRTALGTDPRVAAFDAVWSTHLAPLASLPAAWSDAAARDAMLRALLELTAYLAVELPDVWSAVDAESPGGLGTARRALYDLLSTQTIGPSTWRAVLADTERGRGRIESGDTATRLLVRRQATRAEVAAFAAALVSPAAGAFRARLTAALAADPFTAAPLPAVPTPDAYYVVRCVHERRPCAPYHAPAVSRATRPFRLAAFFDADAPVRPIRIRMPIDTTPDGLSKFPKGVSMLLSDELRKQMARAEHAGLANLMGGPIPAGSLSLGAICSFSIPIITICALILLLIMVSILDIVFRWLPFFRICLPLDLKAR